MSTLLNQHNARRGSVSATPKSPYGALDATLKEIRLLKLAPGDFDDDLVITLQTRRLDEETLEYDALSYVWGKRMSSRNAIVDGLTQCLHRGISRLCPCGIFATA